jgi:hypothetical protein
VLHRAYGKEHVMDDPELCARAGYAAVRLEQAWQRWRTFHRLGGPADPLASYVGYSLAEPMGQPRVVIGFDAAEAIFFADFLDSQGAARSLPHEPASAGDRPAPDQVGAEIARWNLGGKPGYSYR